MKFNVKDDITHLQWIYNRLVNEYGENPNYDYMHRLKKIIDDLKRLNNE